jgi:hypothetical protein
VGKKVFISHSVVDEKMINNLVWFLNKTGIRNDDIFCTSISGTLEGGKSFVEQIKNNVHSSRIVIFLLSERFFLSYFCLAELGAAWALNQNILPIIVPPISTAEYNNTPLIGIQALSIGSENFATELFNDLVRKNVIESDEEIETKELFEEFSRKIKTELSILRQDSKGFYVARLLESYTRKTSRPLKQPPLDQFLFGDRKLISTETLWKLNGLLDIENDSSITEHWIAVSSVSLCSTKLQFELRELLSQSGNQKLFAIKRFYELP